MGQVHIQATVYQLKQVYQSVISQQHIFLLIQIQPLKTKSKTFKLVLNYNDIQKIINFRFNSENCFDRFIIHDTIKTLSKKLIKTQNLTYSTLKLPLKCLSLNPQKQKFDLINKFENKIIGFGLFNYFNSPCDKILETLDFEQNQLNQQEQISAIKKIQLNKLLFELDNHPNTFESLLKNNYLTEQYTSKKTIYKKVIQVQNNFIIVSVIYFPQLQFHELLLYIPKTCRKFICKLHPSDFWKMNLNFLNQIIPQQLWKSNKQIECKFQSYKNFMELDNHFQSMGNTCENYNMNFEESKLSIHIQGAFDSFDYSQQDSIISEEKNQIQSQNQLDEKNQIQTQNQFHHFPSPITEKRIDSVRYGNEFALNISTLRDEEKYLILDFYKEMISSNKNLQQSSLIEMKIWDNLLKMAKIFVNAYDEVSIKLDTYQSVLQEFLLSQEVHLGFGFFVLLEITFDNFSNPLNDVFKQFEQLKFMETALYSVQIKQYFFESLKIYNQKIIMSELLLRYFSTENLFLQNKKQKKNNIHEYRFNLQDFNLFSLYLRNQIIHFYHQQPFSSCFSKQFSSNRGNLVNKVNWINSEKQDLFLEDKEESLNLDSSIEAILNLSGYQYILLYKGVFTKTPSQLIAIFYKKKTQSIHVHMWNVKTGRKTQKRLKLKQIEQVFPHASFMLNMNLYLEVGKRIFLSFKNKLMSETFFILNQDSKENQFQ